MPVHVFWKGQNSQVADKCMDTALKINILQISIPPFPIHKNIANKIKCIYWFDYEKVIGLQRIKVHANITLTSVK